MSPTDQVTPSDCFGNTLTIDYFVVNSTQIVQFSTKTFAMGSSSQKRVVELDRKQWVDVRCEKHRFPYTLSMIFDRLSRHLGLLMLARASAINIDIGDIDRLL